MRRCGKGFTLIELLVVIAIIAILAAILFPVFLAAKQRAASARCLNNQKQLALAFRAYMDDNNGCMPKVQPWNASHAPPLYPPDWSASQYPANAIPDRKPCVPQDGSLWPYTKTLGIYLCDVDRGQLAEHVLGADGFPIRDFPLSYSVNFMLGTVKLDSTSNRRQSRLLLLFHEGRDTINDGNLQWDDASGMDDMPSKVHYDGTNACFVDCHVVYLKYDELVKRRASGEWNPNASH